ncbi:MAG: glycine--tRNA ligase subunit beta [Pseudomonadota bacterium]
MADVADFLVEIGTEELPPGSLDRLLDAFADGLAHELAELNVVVAGDAITRLASPRRLALLVRDVPLRQPDRNEERLGPPVAAATDADGNPTRAAQGFAASCGTTVDQLDHVDTDKGLRLGYVRHVPGEASATLLVGAVERALHRLPVPKPMRWGDHDFAFVRPVHWVVMLLGEDVIDGELLGQPIGRISRGHRFHHADAIHIAEPAAYPEALRGGFVLVDPAERRERVRASVEAAGTATGGSAVIREELLEEVTNLVEWPVALAGRFDDDFLAVPAEALVSSMEKHQKFFPVVDANGELMPRFVGVSNIESTDPEEVIRGYERVIRPRLADARFFWDLDRKRPLEEHRDALAKMVYQKRLGSLDEKAQRVANLAATLADQLGADVDAVRRAASLAKCDLMAEMVGEFPDLQGIMGRYCALEQGESEAVAWAIEEHYLPRFAGDTLPTRPVGRLLAVADRVDTLAGIFAVGLKPTGNKDPYALRRAALGLGRILIEGGVDIDLEALFDGALAAVAEHVPEAVEVRDEVVDFVLERMRAWYHEQGVDTEIFNAVVARRPTRPLDFDRRIQACRTFAALPAAESLAAANKRIGNILRKAEDAIPGEPDAGALTDASEQALAAEIAEAAGAVLPQIAAGAYGDALARLAELAPTVDRFFDEVLVMADNPIVRRNRLALLAQLKGLFDGIADISLLARAR